MAKVKKLRQGKYKVVNWVSYNKSLKQRGDLTIWFTEEAIGALLEVNAIDKDRGGQKKYDSVASINGVRVKLAKVIF